MSHARLSVGHRIAVALVALGITTSTFAADELPAAPLALSTESFSLRLPKSDAVFYQGMLNADGLGSGSGAMFYPVGGVAGLLVAVAVHAAVVSSTNDSRRSEAQIAADRVLAPHKDAIGSVTHRLLMQHALDRLAVPGARLIEATDAGSGWIVESVPVFSLSPDASALVLENEVTVRAAARPKDVRYRTVVKVVSTPRDDDTEADVYWGDQGGLRLKQESIAMYVHSMKLLLEAAAISKADGTPKSLRYVQGSVPKVERAQVVREKCGRAVVQTLRGWWMSVPLRVTAAPAAADAAASSAVPAGGACGSDRYAV